MAQYTSSQTTAGGLVINAILDSITNTITYTATAPNGASTTTTAPASEVGNSVANVNSLRNPLRTQGVTTAVYFGIGDALESVQISVSRQAAQAQATATVTDTPPPAESTPIPVASANNPNTTPAPSEPLVENATTPATGQTAADAAFQEANASPQQTIDPNSDPNTNIGAGGQDVTGFEPLTEPPATSDGDEFSGIDEQVQRQKDLEDGSLEFAGIDQQVANNENGLQEPPQLSEEEIAQQIQQAGQTDGEIQESVFDPTGAGGNTGALAETRGAATNQDAVSFEKAKDWRVRLSLAPSAKYLYKADVSGILKPLAATNGVIFPYTPSVSVVYAASYDASELIHSNYKIYNYKNSNVDTVTITGDFTAQDTNEANYLLAVIHFFKSVTKMFYGQDQNPRNGVPPPLVYMSGLGTFQFDNHPLAVTNFTYSLPNEVDYIRAGSTTTEPGSSTAGQNTVNNTDNASTARIQSSGLGVKVPNFQRQQATINSNATYVPTKMQIVITCIPIVTRNDISNKFSLRDYATGALLQGSKRNGGGIW